MDRIARGIAIIIRGYQRWVGPAIPTACRFFPTCSQYALDAVERHGPVRGLGLAIWRLLRCHPYHPGGFDPVP
jgi:putative membrane protein insertion efficiency factor